MSLRARLTLGTAAVIAILLCIFSVITYVIVSSNLYASVDQSLLTRAESAQLGSVNLNQHQDNSGPINYGQAILWSGDSFAEITTMRGFPIWSSSNMGPLLIPIPDKIAYKAAMGKTVFGSFSVGQHELRVLVMPVLLFTGKPAELVVGQSLDPINLQLEHLALILSLGSIFTTLLAIVLVWIVSAHALKPLSNIAETALDIGQRNDLSKRVEGVNRNDEVGKLAKAFNSMLDALKKAHDQLGMALENQKRFVADASHELRTPLTIILTNVGILKKHGTGSTEADEIIKDIDREARRMRRLVNDLLTLARADSGQQLSLKRVNLNETVAKAIQTVFPNGQGRKVEVNLPSKVYVNADPDKLMELLIILLDNANKYAVPESKVYVIGQIDNQAKQIEVSIEDEGPGVPEEYAAKIFERFFRADPQRSSDGSGLGLSIGSWIAQQHGGKLAYRKSSLGGSAFYFQLFLGNS